jgi:hypothetical protein|tara:strand:- start:523 stop:1116 length:594 start_codon:yes stop_codon:yes gene_type:complete
MNKSDIITYVLVIFIIFLSFKIYEESDYFNLKCVISKKDGHKYCVRNRENLESSASLLEVVTQKCQKMVDILYEKYPKQERVIRLKNGFNPQRINEILPNSQYTAYSENKGEKLAFCLTKQKDGTNLIDVNTLTFVALHEISHIMTESIGHTDEFWTNFKFMLKEADMADVYRPVDYKNDPITYCGMDITDNPLYDY